MLEIGGLAVESPNISKISNDHVPGEYGMNITNPLNSDPNFF